MIYVKYLPEFFGSYFLLGCFHFGLGFKYLVRKLFTAKYCVHNNVFSFSF